MIKRRYVAFTSMQYLTNFTDVTLLYTYFRTPLYIYYFKNVVFPMQSYRETLA